MIGVRNGQWFEIACTATLSLWPTLAGFRSTVQFLFLHHNEFFDVILQLKKRLRRQKIDYDVETRTRSHGPKPTKVGQVARAHEAPAVPEL